MAEGEVVGSAYVAIRPDTTGLASATQRGVRAALARIVGQVRVDPDAAGFAPKVRDISRRAAAAATSKVKIDPETTGFASRVRDVAQGAARSAKAEVPITGNASRLNDEVGRAARAASIREAVQLAIRAAPSPLLPAQIREIATTAANGVTADIPLDVANAGGFASEVRRAVNIAEAQARLKVDVDTDEATGAIARLGTNARGAGGGVGDLKNRLFQLAGGGALAAGALQLIKLPALIAGASAAAGAVGVLSGALFALLASLGPLVGLGPAAAAGLLAFGQAAGVVKLATAGIGAAFKDLIAQEKEAATAAVGGANTAAAAARAREAAAERVRSATRSVAQAQEQAAEANVAALRRVEDAQRSLDDARVAAGDAAQAAADDQADAARRVEDAELALAEANRQARAAQDDLNDARATAIQRLDDLNDRVRQNALTEEDAILDVEEARLRAANAAAEPGPADSIEKRRADLSLRQALERLDEVRERRQRDAAELEEANRRGVDGSDEVLAARERIAAADRGAVDAARDLADARAAADRAAIDGARSIALAQRAVADAARDLADAEANVADVRADGADSVAEAQRALALALRDQGRAGTEAAAGTAAQRDALAGLNPVARALVLALRSAKVGYDDLKASAQEALFPGLITAIGILTPLFGFFEPVVARTAGAIGALAVRGAELVASPAFSGQLNSILEANVPLITRMGDAALILAPALLTLVQAAQPLLAFLVDLGVRAAENAARFIEAADASGGLTRFFRESQSVLGVVLGMLGSLSRILIDVGVAAYDTGRSLLDSMAEGLRSVEELTGSVAGQTALRDFFASIEEPARAIGGLIGDIARGFGGLFRDLGPSITPVVEAVRAQLLPTLLELFSNMDGRFLLALVNLATKFVGFADTFLTSTPALSIFIDALAGLLDIAVRVVDALGPFGDILVNIFALLSAAGLVAGIIAVVQAIGSFIGVGAGAALVGKALAAAFWALSAPVLGVIAVIGLLIAAGYLIIRNWDTIKAAASVAWQFIQDVVDRAIAWVRQVISDGLAFISAVWFGTWTTIRGFFVGLWQGLQDIVRGGIAFVSDLIRGALDFIRGVWFGVWTHIRDFLSGIWAGITDRARGALDFVRGIVQGALDFIRGVWFGAWSGIRDFLGGVWSAITGAARGAMDGVRNTIQGAVDGIRRIWDGLIGIFRTPINIVIGFVNRLIGGANTILSKVGLGTIHPIPSLHTGGVVGEDGPGDRLGRRGPLREDEQIALLQKGEGVLDRKAMRRLGREGFEALRSGRPAPAADETTPPGRKVKLPLEADVLPEWGGFPGSGIIRNLIDKGINFALDRAIDVVQGVLRGVNAAASPFGTAGRMATYPARAAGDGVIEWLNGLKRESADAAAAQAAAGGAAGTFGAGSVINRLIGVVRSSGVPHRVTSTLRRGGGTSYHNVGRAVDFAGPTPGNDTPALGAIFRAFRNVEGQLAELIYAGPQVTYNIKNGRRVGKYAQAIHHNHVHAALERGGVFDRPFTGVLSLAESPRARPEIVAPAPLMREIVEEGGDRAAELLEDVLAELVAMRGELARARPVDVTFNEKVSARRVIEEVGREL